MHAVLCGTAQTADACKVGLASCNSLAAVITQLRAFCNSPRGDTAQLKAVTSARKAHNTDALQSLTRRGVL
jgi:hypothetical protein